MTPRGKGARAADCPASVFVPPVTLLLLLCLCAPALCTEPLIARIDSLWTNDQRDAAVSMLEVELPRARVANDSVMVSNLLVIKGSFNVFLGNLPIAEAVLLEGLAMARARQDSTLVMSGLRWLGLTIGNQGRQDEAMVIFAEVLELGGSLGDRRHQGWANVGLGWANWRNGKAETALAQYERATELFVGTGDVQGELWANNGVAAVNSDLGRYDQAAEGYRATIDVARFHDRAVPEAIALNNLGTLEYSLGRPDVAVEYFRQARVLHAQSQHKRQELPPRFNIALCQNDLGQHTAARQTLDEALALCDTYGYRDMRSRTLVKIANMEVEHGRLNQAAALIHDAMSDPETMMVKDVVEAEIELGEAWRLQGDFSMAARRLAQADSILGNKTFPWVRLRLMGNQARVFRDLGEYQRALEQFLQLAEQAIDLGMPQYRLSALSDAAQTCMLLGRTDQARSLYEEAATAWETDRQQLLSPQWRERRGASGRDIFTDLALLIHEDGDPAGAFDQLQTYKSRTLLERMLGPGETLSRSLSRSHGTCTQLGDVQTNLLSADELLLDFTLGPRVSLLFAVTRDTLVLRRLPASGLITGRVRAYHDLLKDPDAGSPTAVAAVGAGLRDLLLSDLPTVFAGKEHILVAPDGALNLLPFADMEIPGHAPEWLRVPSASILMKLRQDDRKNSESIWRILAVASEWSLEASPLPGTLLEVEHLARNYKRVESRVLSGEESELPSLAGYDILHLAAHASNDDQSPWQSAIRFLPDEQGGYLRATDVLELQLDAGLAVLSSCSSGTGKILNGEGVLGLSTAFLSAGVPAVLASLWAVDDGATAQFMELYYGFLATEQTCAEALTSAQQKMRVQTATRHPYYWAGFVLIGDGTLQPHVVRSREWTVPASVGILAFGFLISTARLWRPRARPKAGRGTATRN
ncbi:hypothetical protein DRQ53_05595 [bacterium]|nr:MAG: hypothetical protein DRQ53_05595 [bacterium]